MNYTISDSKTSYLGSKGRQQCNSPGAYLPTAPHQLKH